MTSSVVLSRQDSTLIVTLNRPERRNAFDLEMRKSIADAVFVARDTDDVKVVVLTGAGGTFCAGGDLKSLGEKVRPVLACRDRIRKLHPWFREMVNLEKPVIAAVEGAAFGAGFNLALASDFVIASSDARFCAVFARIGLVPDLGGLYLLPRIVGLQRAKEIVFTAREVKAKEALALGIAYAVCPKGKALEEALALAARLADAPTQALGMAKNILNRSFNLDQDTLAELESYAQALAMHTEYHRDAVGRFLAKKPLAFNWDKPG
ncbi:MAG: enoyl-CoA hydratase/isomerase family protein [Proteobacteria bacterium]|nr:enoyl-CoA hydratase/isomerase family protein [Pseudomonadota bacterium]